MELTRYGRAVARIVPPRPERKIALNGCMKGQFSLPGDMHDGDAEIAAMFAASEIFPK